MAQSVSCIYIVVACVTPLGYASLHALDVHMFRALYTDL